MRSRPSIRCGWSIDAASTAAPPCPSAPATRPAGVPSCPSPSARWVGQFHPVPLGLLPGRVRDHRDRPVLRGVARLALPGAGPGAQLAGQRRIRPVVPQVGQLVEQGGRPQVRVLGQPGGTVVGERLERIQPRAGPAPRAGGRRAGRRGSSCGPARGGGRSPRSSTPGVRRACASMSSSHVSMSGGAPSSWRVVRDRQPRGSPARLGGATRVGNFSEQVWGDSPERRHVPRWRWRGEITPGSSTARRPRRLGA